MSRPFLPPEVRAVHPVGVKVTAPEWAMLTREATRRGMKPARLLRELAVAALRDIEEKERDPLTPL